MITKWTSYTLIDLVAGNNLKLSITYDDATSETITVNLGAVATTTVDEDGQPVTAYVTRFGSLTSAEIPAQIAAYLDAHTAGRIVEQAEKLAVPVPVPLQSMFNQPIPNMAPTQTPTPIV